VRALHDTCSDPALETILGVGLLERWFVGLPLFGDTPDHTTLSRFHAWTTAQRPTALFDDALAFVDRVDPEDPRATLQVVDTFALASPVAPQAPAVILMRCTARLAALWLAHAPLSMQDALPADLDLQKLRTAREAPSKAKGQRQLQYAVRDARRTITALTPHLHALDPATRTLVQEQIATIEKVIADDTETDADGQVVKRQTSGAYRIASAVDPDATFRKHEGTPAVLGYNAAIATTRTRICAAQAFTGSTPDSETLVPLLRQQMAATRALPRHVGGDRAFGWGKTRAQVDACTQGQTQVVARIPQAGGRDPTRYGPADFRARRDAAGAIVGCVCPAGRVSTRAHTSGAGDGVRVRYRAADCQGCARWAACRGQDATPTGNRDVFLSAYHEYLRQAAQFNATEAGQTLVKSRWSVEPTIAWVVRYHGCRRARRVGQAAAQFQLVQACAVRNLLLWLARVRRGTAVLPTREQIAAHRQRLHE
jgi:hypothetical protein